LTVHYHENNVQVDKYGYKTGVYYNNYNILFI